MARRIRPGGLYLPGGGFLEFAENADNDMTGEIATRKTAFGQFGPWLTWLPNPDPVLKKRGESIQVYRDLRSSAVIGGAVRRRKAAVLSMEHGLGKARTQYKKLQSVGAVSKARGRPQATDRIAAEIDAILADLPLRRIITEALDAPLYGYQPMEILWGKVGPYLVPVNLVGKPPEWFAYSWQNELLFKSIANPLGEPVPPHKFIVGRQEPTYLNPYGFPDLSMVFWPEIFRKGGLGFWAKFTEKYGMPWPIGKYDRKEDPAGTKVSNLLDALERMVQDGLAAIPNDASVELLVNNQSQGADAYEKLLDYCSFEINTALLGQDQTTKADATRASAQAGKDVAKEIRDGDAEIVAQVLDELIGAIKALNFPDVRLPRYEFWEQEEIDEMLVKRDKLLVEAGVRPTRVYWMRTYGFQEDELEPDAPPPQLGRDTPAFAGADDGNWQHDQETLDGAVARFMQDPELRQEGEALCNPILALAEAKGGFPGFLEALAGLYPKLDTGGLEERLSQAMFAAELWGYVHGLDEGMPLPEFAAADQIDLLYAMGLSPKEAVDFFKRKKLLLNPGSWRETVGKIHESAFTVAHLARLDVLQDVRDAVQAALDQGQTFREFQANLRPTLIKKGWWGPAIDPDTGEVLQTYPDSSVPVEWGSPRRLRLIYEVNLQSAFQAGRRARQLDNVDDRPYWMYVAIMDSRTRPEHRALHGLVFRYDDPFWQSFYPPLGFRCRCRVRALGEHQVGTGAGQARLLDSEGRMKAMMLPLSKTNPDHGEVEVQAYEYARGKWAHPDPGWSHPPGEGWTPNLDRYHEDLVAQYRKAAA